MTAITHRLNNTLISLLLVAALLSGCAAPPPAATALLPVATSTSPAEATSTAPPAPSPTAEPDFDLESLASRDYTLTDFSAMLPDTGGVVQLKDGVFDYPIPDSAAVVHVQFIDGALGDLDADGDQDAIAALAVNTGGSGTFIYLIALINQDGGLQQTGSLLLGDRVQVKSLAVREAGLDASLVTHAPGDPLCCPSLEKASRYRLVEGRPVAEEHAEVLEQALTAVRALEAQDMQALAELAHPTQGVRFSPYSFVRDEDLVFTPQQLAGLMADPARHTWGAFDGSGQPIEMPFSEYYPRFVYSNDFAHPDEIRLNRRLGMGSTIDNSQEFYSGSVVVEFYRAPQDPQYGGMDWQSLRLVFQPDGDVWRLVGVIHDEWTT